MKLGLFGFVQEVASVFRDSVHVDTNMYQDISVHLKR